MNIIRSWNGRIIRIRKDRYVSLTDMAQATGEKVNDFLETPRALAVANGFYKYQQDQIYHAVVEEGEDVWVCPPLAKEFCYQSKNYDFSIWMDDILWEDFLKPEILPVVLDRINFKKCKYPEISSDQLKVYTYVYFILNESKNIVKIGFSKNPEARLNTFQCGTVDSLRLLKTIYGTKKDESRLHAQFADYRVYPHKEMFYYKGSLKAFIDKL